MTETVLVKGSAFSSQTSSRRSSALRRPRAGLGVEGFEHGELLNRKIQGLSVPRGRVAQGVQVYAAGIGRRGRAVGWRRARARARRTTEGSGTVWPGNRLPRG